MVGEKWCDHIERWSGSVNLKLVTRWQFTNGTRNMSCWVNAEDWKICPICKELRPISVDERRLNELIGDMKIALCGGGGHWTHCVDLVIRDLLQKWKDG